MDISGPFAKYVRHTPSGRLATVEVVAFAAQFLCSDAASGIIVQTLVVGGGIGTAA